MNSERSRVKARAGGAGVLLVAILGPGAAEPLAGQFTWRDVVVTAGASAEGYQGNLPAVSVPVSDSTEFASAVVGEVAIRADAFYRMAENGSFSVAFDGGFRQFSARGFELQDYAPREWVGTLDGGYTRGLGSRAGLTARVRLRGREIQDRPPMPLFLQPGYRNGQASVGLDVDGPRDVLYDVEVGVSRTDFMAPAFAPQVRLLDRDGATLEAGATLTGGGASNLRVFVGVEASRYPRQSTFDPADPHRRDRTFNGGAVWTHQADHLIQVGLEGRVNRSNSNRPEYDALTIRGLFSASLPHQVSFSAYGAVTAKQYVHASEFARLLPGEEGNNASLAYLSLSRGIARNLDGTVRVGWARAETEIGDAYFQRFGASFLLHYRPIR